MSDLEMAPTTTKPSSDTEDDSLALLNVSTSSSSHKTLGRSVSSATDVSTTAISTADEAATFMGGHFLTFLVSGWVLDFGRPVFTHRSYTLFGLDTHAGPRLGDYMHFVYDLIMINLLCSMMDHTSIKPSPIVVRFTVAIMTHGMAFHLVGDAVQSRLVDMGVDTSQHVHETPLIEACSDAVVDVYNMR
jgi:hypothetical protein